MGKGAIPDRWLDYTPVGQPVEGTRFIAFKVPLKKNVVETVDNVDTRLDTDTLLQIVPNLGMIIDLTNTTRYYNPTDFVRNGIQYIKLCVPGHHVPEKHLRIRFCEFVQMFLKENKYNDKLIGVHCTHGVNRTGFFICDHMINEDDFDPKVAVERFASARGHPIERQNYISALLYNNIFEHNNDKKRQTNTIAKSGVKFQENSYLRLVEDRATKSDYNPRYNERYSSKQDILKRRSLISNEIKPGSKFQENNSLRSAIEEPSESYYEPRDNKVYRSREDRKKRRSLAREINIYNRFENNGNRSKHENQGHSRNFVEYSLKNETANYRRLAPSRENSKSFTETSSSRFIPKDREFIPNYNIERTPNNWMNHEESSFRQDNFYHNSRKNSSNKYSHRRNQDKYKWKRKDKQQR